MVIRKLLLGLFLIVSAFMPLGVLGRFLEKKTHINFTPVTKVI